MSRSLNNGLVPPLGRNVPSSASVAALNVKCVSRGRVREQELAMKGGVVPTAGTIQCPCVQPPVQYQTEQPSVPGKQASWRECLSLPQQSL